MVKNILIIGITGNGKSALANALAGTSDTNKFGEGNASVSQTTDSQKSEPFKWNGKEYRVIDNIGFGDNRDISEEDILLKIGEGIHSAKEGISQVLFIFGGRFGPEHVKAFKKFESFISESKITEFTTLVRTNFIDFKKNKKCDADRENLLKQNPELVELIKSCKGGIVYVDNPPVSVKNEETVQINQRRREASREKILNHLDNLTNELQKPYTFGEWNSIYELVDNYIREKKEIEEKNNPNKEDELRKLKSKATEIIKSYLAGELSTFGKLTAAIEYMKK